MMKYQPEIHHRRSLRLKGYDYAQAGFYFVTICAHARQCLFGEIVDSKMQENDYGRIVKAEWMRSADIRAEIELGEFVVMPNHLHGIVSIIANDRIDDGKGDRSVALYGRHRGIGHCQGDRFAGDRPGSKAGSKAGDWPVAPTVAGPGAKSLGALLAGFKSAVTKRINTLRNAAGVPVWQRNYYEHIIRNEADYARIVEYVATNPQRWIKDTLHPVNQTKNPIIP
ncbi:MAG: transposase [Geopsychrobacter sp.]|nr:transposase [Geopsychrobacter sp.]